MPLVSVVMPVFNREEYLAEAIESILTQTFADFELIIVDDGSQDRSAEIIRAYAKRDERVRFYRHARNLGIAAARNRGIAAAKGKYIAGMDSDDLSLPERLSKQVCFLDAHPEIGAVGTGCHTVDQELVALDTHLLPREHAFIALNLFAKGAMLGATVMMRCAFPKAVGGYDSGVPFGSDTDLFVRMLCDARIRYANLQDALMLYRRHENAMSIDLQAVDKAELQESRRRALSRLGINDPESTLERIQRLRIAGRLPRAERRRTQRDFERFVELMAAANWITADDASRLLHYMRRRLEQTSPRLWQKFCHWRRHRFGRPA